MDIVHHALIGGASLLAVSSFDQTMGAAGFLAGSVFPDLDIVFLLLGKRFYLRNHQGITHSIILGPLCAFAICQVFMFLLDTDWNWQVYTCTLLGIYIHTCMDWFNTFRIAMFSPIVRKRYSLDAVFFIDSISLCLTGLYYLLYGLFRIELVLYAYPLLFLLYFVFKLLLRQKVVSELKPLFAIPSSLNPLEYYILSRDGIGLSGYLYNALRKSNKKKEYYAPIDEKYLRLAEKSLIFNDVRKITRALHIL